LALTSAGHPNSIWQKRGCTQRQVEPQRPPLTKITDRHPANGDHVVASFGDTLTEW
jgi:hypothetical protein